MHLLWFWSIKPFQSRVVDYILHRLSTALNINFDVGFQKLLKYMYVAGKPNSLT